MSYLRPSFTQLYNTCISNLNSVGVQPLAISVSNAFANMVSSLANMLYGFLDYISIQSVPYTATGTNLQSWSALKGIFRKPATFASGFATFTGTSSTTIPNGTILTRSDGVQYVTNTPYVVGVSSPVGISAVIAGESGNANSGITVSLFSGIAGVNSTGIATSPIVGGQEVETDTALRERMLVAFSMPPQGGSQQDYTQWGLQAGATRAWAKRTSPGLVSLWVMVDGNAFNGFPQGNDGGATEETRIAPASSDLLLIANAVYPLRPLTAVVDVIAPIPSIQNFRILNLVPNTTAVQTAIAAALQNLCFQEGNPLGTGIQISDVYAAIQGAGAQSFYLATPNVNIILPVGQLPTVGTVTFF